FLGGVASNTLGNRQAVLGKQLLALIFMKIHVVYRLRSVSIRHLLGDVPDPRLAGCYALPPCVAPGQSHWTAPMTMARRLNGNRRSEERQSPSSLFCVRCGCGSGHQRLRLLGI